MKIAFLLLCLVASASAQTGPTARQAAACGPAATKFNVRLEPSQHGPLPPKPGMAQVYFIHDSGLMVGGARGYPTTKYGVDGSWVGAGHGNSWFEIAIAPGEHHLCATLQSPVVNVVKQRVELAHFTAEAGKVYYFRTRLVMAELLELLELDRIDSDQGEYLVSTFPMASATEKKLAGNSFGR